jgi:uncharacterized protein YidB (DUF937 family)
MSGFLGTIMNSLMGGAAGAAGGAGAGAMGGVLQQVLASQGGMGGLVQKFQQNGMGDHVQSWVGNGANMPVSGDQVGQMFSPQQIEGWAQSAGLPVASFLPMLAQVLPHAVDQATPGGQHPAPDDTSNPFADA